MNTTSIIHACDSIYILMRIVISLQTLAIARYYNHVDTIHDEKACNFVHSYGQSQHHIKVAICTLSSVISAAAVWCTLTSSPSFVFPPLHGKHNCYSKCDEQSKYCDDKYDCSNNSTNCNTNGTSNSYWGFWNDQCMCRYLAEFDHNVSKVCT